MLMQSGDDQQLLSRAMIKLSGGSLSSSLVGAAIRLSSLVGKFLLSLYMARFMGLEDLGLYGLVFSATMISVSLLGFRIDYALMREVGRLSRDQLSERMKAANLLFLGSYLAIAAPFFLIMPTFAPEMSSAILLCMFVLCCTEHFASAMYNIAVALGRANTANILFFVRGGLWTAPAILLGIVSSPMRTADFVLGCWAFFSVISVVMSIHLLRDQIAWRVPLRIGENERNWLGSAVRSSFGVWLGTVAYAAGGYADRFIVNNLLSLTAVGVATFYLSFTLPISTLVQSATFVPRQARLVELHDGGENEQYRALMRKTLLAAAVLALTIAAAMAVLVSLSAQLLGKSELIASQPVFWLILAGAVLRTIADGLFYPLFVEHRTRTIWGSDLFFCAAVVILTASLLPPLGLYGLGVASVASASLILLVRVLALRSKPRPRSDAMRRKAPARPPKEKPE
jgi:O-antigen/teichoic acid export membrane protein